MQKIMDYHWPGNVRELENAIEHAFVLCNSNTIDLPHLPMEIRAMASQSNHVSTPLSTNTVETSDWGALTREGLVDLLHQCKWNKAEAARRLDISRTAVWKRMKQWDIPLQEPA